MLEFTVQVSEADFYAANKKLFFKGWAPRQVLIALVCSAIPFAGAAWTAIILTAGDPESTQLLAMSIGAGFAALILAARFATCWYQLPSTSNSLHAKHGTLMLPNVHRLTHDRFQTRYEEGSSDHPWSRFMDYIDAGTVLILRRTAGFVFIVPKHQLSVQQLDDLIALLAQAGIKSS
jgi:hypothetical protein